MRIAASILAGSVAGWFVAPLVLDAIRLPVAAMANQPGRLAQLNFDSVTGAFDLKIQIAFTVGIVVASPFWLFQVWAFLIPALTRKEVKYSLGFFLSAVPLFFAGCAAGWFVVPHMIALLGSFVPSGDAAFFTATDYFGFILKLVLVIGIAFVLPVFCVLLNFIGVISGASLRRSWRIVLLAIVLFTAAATPSADLVSMFALAVPMALLFAAAIAVAIVHDRRAALRLTHLTRELAV
jgi:sec-independent protein translocase protein TatC